MLVVLNNILQRRALLYKTRASQDFEAVKVNKGVRMLPYVSLLQ